MRVLVLYNQPVLPLGHPDAESENEVVYTAGVVGEHLKAAGFYVGMLGVTREPESLLRGLREHRPDVVFNLFEGFADDYGSEYRVAATLEWLGIPFTGCPSACLSLSRSKPMTKRLLRGDGLPTPQFLAVEELPIPECTLGWPVIVKPGEQDASVGLDQGSVVTSQSQLETRVAALLEAYGPPVLVEEFVRGREIMVALMEDADGLHALPPAEILFPDEPGYWPIVTYDAKWRPESRDYGATPTRYPTKVSPRLAERLEVLAKRAFRLLGCRDYARIDFRVKSPARPYILEVNPNPCFWPTAGFTASLETTGRTHAEFTVDLVRNARARHGSGARLSAGVDAPVPV